jgi:poly(hydroxyalkanoate) granule-associated protein
MVKKIQRASAKSSTASAAAHKASHPAAALLDSQLAGSIKDSAQQIWLAGMGAWSRTQAEGGKVFEALVSEGLKLQKKTQGLAEDKISEVTGKMSAMAGTVQAKAEQNWDKLEAIFEARTAKAMNKLGVPTAADVQSLAQRVDELAAAVAKLNKGSKPVAAPVKKAAASVNGAVRGVKGAVKTASKRVRRAVA